MIKIYEEKKEIIKFLIVGLSGVLVNMFFLWLFKDIIGIEIWLSGIIAIEISVINNFIFNNFWTFKSRINNKAHVSFIKYHLSVLLGIAINYIVLITLSEIFGIYYLISNLIGIGLATISNYLISSRWAWKP